LSPGGFLEKVLMQVSGRVERRGDHVDATVHGVLKQGQLGFFGGTQSVVVLSIDQRTPAPILLPRPLFFLLTGSLR